MIRCLSLSAVALCLASCVTLTPTIRTPVSTVSARITFAPESQIVQRCPDIQTVADPNLIAQGQILLNIFDGSTDLLFKDFHRQRTQTVSLLGAYTSDAKVSPDRKHLAFKRNLYDSNQRNAVAEELALVNADGVEKQLAWQNGWGRIAGWLDNEHLLVVPRDQPAGTVSIINVSTDQQQTLVPSFPDVYDEYPPTSWWTEAVYNSTLTRVAYFRKAPQLGVALWDLQTGKVLAELNSEWTISVQPEWSPSGTWLAVSAPPDLSRKENNELLLINEQGVISQRTDFSSLYSRTRIVGLSWSPNGDLITFWLTASQSDVFTEPAHLVVFDLKTQRLVEYCLKGRDSTGGTLPLWSPNSQQVIVEHFSGVNSSRFVILDVEDNYAFQLRDGFVEDHGATAEIIGWMVESDGK